MYFWILQQLSTKKYKNRGDVKVFACSSSLPFQKIWEWSGECVSASSACRSAVRLAWRSEGGTTQTVANSVVADWQKKVDECV